MQETKLTVRVPCDLLENFKRYAADNNTTLTDLIEAYLRALPAPETLENAPIVRRLARQLVTGGFGKGLQETPGRKIWRLSPAY